MSLMRIVVCETQAQANLTEQRMRLRGFTIIQPAQQFHDVIWDASQANPADPPLAFGDHFVVIGHIP